jgi:hypothetical protein
VGVGSQVLADSPIDVWFDLPLTLAQSLDFTVRSQNGQVITASSVNFVTFTVTLD